MRRVRPWNLLLDAVLPRLCPACEVEVVGRRWLCGRCRRRLRVTGPERVCLDCRREDPSRPWVPRSRCARTDHGRSLVSAYAMAPPLDAIVHRFKYGGGDGAWLAPALARLLADRVAPSADMLVTAVPLHPARRRERGFDQAGALAREAAFRWGVPYLDGVLRRGVATRPQATSGPAHRRGDLEGVFEAGYPSWIPGRTWVLVDDVATSGATLASAAETLMAGGARGVLGVVLARSGPG